jgi:hypothetical protein
MNEAKLQELLSECFEVRLKRDKLSRVHELLQQRCSLLTQHRIGQEIDLAWDTVWRAFSKEDGMTLSTLAEIEGFAIPQLKRSYARGTDARELARLILDSPQLEDELADRLRRESAEKSV